MKWFIFILLVLLALEVNIWAAPRVEFQSSTKDNELPPLETTGSVKEEPSFFNETSDVMGKWAEHTFNGEVYKQDSATEPRLSKLASQASHDAKTLLSELLKYYQKSQIDPEGIESLSIRGDKVDKQVEFYRAHPDQLAQDVYRRIQFVRYRRGVLGDLSDVFVLQNAFRRLGSDPIENLVSSKSWLAGVHEPSDPRALTHFPIHLVTMFKDQSTNLALNSSVTVLPTAIRWPNRMGGRPQYPRKISSQDMRSHLNCLRVTSGDYAGQYHSHGLGPHRVGHPDVEWWSDLFHREALRPRRIAVLVSVGATMKEADLRSAVGSQGCLRYRALTNLIQSRWESMSYALIPFSDGILGVSSSESGAPFLNWKTDSKQMSRELNEWACAYRASKTSRAFDRAEVIKTLQRNVFGGTYQYGDSVIVIVAAGDPHYADWVSLAQVSGGIRSYASSQGVVAALDLSLRGR